MTGAAIGLAFSLGLALLLIAGIRRKPPKPSEPVRDAEQSAIEFELHSVINSIDCPDD